MILLQRRKRLYVIKKIITKRPKSKTHPRRKFRMGKKIAMKKKNNVKHCLTLFKYKFFL